VGCYVSTSRLRYRLSRHLRGLWSGSRRTYAGFADSEYFTADIDELRQFLRNTPLQPVAAFGEVFDCDDYAFVLKGAASLYARDSGRLTAGLCVGIAWGSFTWKSEPRHACNWSVDSDNDFWWIEPQDNGLYPLSECSGDLEMILI